MANVELDVPNTPQTVFRRLRDQTIYGDGDHDAAGARKLNVKTRFANICECPAAWQPITIKHLLTHTAGIPNYTNFPDFARRRPADHHRRLIAISATSRSISRPAKNTLQQFGLFPARPDHRARVRQILRRLLAGKHLRAAGDETHRLRQSRPHLKTARRVTPGKPAKYQRLVYGHDHSLRGGRALLDDRRSLLWDQALYTEKLVSRKSLDEMFTPFKNGYGYGWGIGKRFDRQVIAHGGGIYGFATTSRVSRRQSYRHRSEQLRGRARRTNRQRSGRHRLRRAVRDTERAQGDHA